ncbi:choice-of-anchor P family protein [Sphingomonas nostoxanthinifaciens]|uniref:choice-of-anchor P family protein n=1 Tax=Sphingomonas nostoxanthinifaciens TaxID=2872652 RepID=UPI001CC1D5B9|nr:choice-of-anchor P family protein [Sphingomonas nostoxanthinifaciens]UAK23535.1 PEPxxWA-CTERM sorting domain-containing protein [Sphingomonas nostoxanthinifaciens]
MKRSLAIHLAPVALLLCGTGAQATTTLTSAASAVSTSLNVAGVVKVNTTIAGVSGTAGTAYDNTGNVASVNLTTPLVSGIVSAGSKVTTGVVSTEAFSSAPWSATGTANVAGANIALYTQLLSAIPLTSIGISLNAISSMTTVGLGANGYYGTGSSSIAGLALSGSVLGALGINTSLISNPSASTVLATLPGLTLTLNEQITSTLTNGLSMSTNALHLALNDYAFDGQLLSGDIILGHSEASITGAVPEASSWAMMVVGFGLLGGLARRRKPVPLNA